MANGENDPGNDRKIDRRNALAGISAASTMLGVSQGKAGAPPVRLICVEEHTIGREIAGPVLGVMRQLAPYSVNVGGSAQSTAHRKDRPSIVPVSEAIALAGDLGHDRIAMMDKHGIDMQVVSSVMPVHLLPDAVARVRAENDRIARAVAAHPKRLAGFATVPWLDPDAAVVELDRAIQSLGLKGVLIGGRPGAGPSFLDHAPFEKILRRMQELKVPLYIHPFVPLEQVQQVYYAGFSPAVTAAFSIGGWGWHSEAGVQVLRMILAGIFDRLPDLQVISGHWGEMVPFFLARLDDAIPQSVTGFSRTISEIYRSNVWVTPSGLFDMPHFEFIHKVIGPQRILWSVDYPFLSLDGTRPFLDRMVVSPEEKAAMMHSNAERLLKVLSD